MEFLSMAGIIIASVIVTLLIIWAIMYMKRSRRRRCRSRRKCMCAVCAQASISCKECASCMSDSGAPKEAEQFSSSRMKHVSAEQLNAKIPHGKPSEATSLGIERALAENLDPSRNDGLGTKSPTDNYNYARTPFGVDGVDDYSDFAASQAISLDVIRNHAKYQKQRQSPTSRNMMGGRPMMMDSHDSYMPIKWSGLRRPQAVPNVGDPVQVPDIDYDLYSKKPSLVWG